MPNIKILIKLFLLSCIWICCVWCYRPSGGGGVSSVCSVHLSVGGHSKWPKHVRGYSVYDTIHLHICICTCSSYFS